MSNLIKEDDLDSFLDSYLKSLILPKIIGLAGPLGAGKTTIAKKIIKFFGCNDVVTSPTFNIVKNYGSFVIIGVVIGAIFAATLKTKSLVLFFSGSVKGSFPVGACFFLQVFAQIRKFL